MTPIENITFAEALEDYICSKDRLLSPSTVRGYRTREIPIDILVKLSKIYGISVDYLFCVSDFAVLDDALVRTQTKELIDSLSATQVFEVKGYIRRMIESKSEDE